MKIRRTVKQHYYDRPLWPKPVDAGATEIIDEDRMERIIRGTLGTPRVGDSRTPDEVTRAVFESLKTDGKIETFYANYELLEA